jgi:hypothetical protein
MKTAPNFCQFSTKRALKSSKISFYLMDYKNMVFLVDDEAMLTDEWKKLRAVFPRPVFLCSKTTVKTTVIHNASYFFKRLYTISGI